MYLLQVKYLHLLLNNYKKINTISGVTYTSLVAEEKALVKIGENQTVVTLKGVDANYTKLTNVQSKIIRGKFAVGTIEEPNLILGYGVENALGIISNQIPQHIRIFLPNREGRFTGSINDFSVGDALPTATFAIQQDFDNKYTITNVDFVKSLMGLDSNQYTAIEIAVTDEDMYDAIKSSLQKTLGKDYAVQTKYEQNQSLYNVMRYEKWGVYGIFCLVLLIASFTIVGALTMLVLEKKKDIGILKSMGAANSYVQKIFLTEGVLLGVIGIGIGIILGILICLMQMKFKLIKLSGGSFLVDYYPVKIELPDLILITSTVFLITLLAAFLPAKKAALQQLELK